MELLRHVQKQYFVRTVAEKNDVDSTNLQRVTLKLKFQCQFTSKEK